MKKVLLLTLLLFFATGCTPQPPTPQQIEAADYGNNMEQNQAETLIKKWMQFRLKDAASAQYNFAQLQKGYFQAGIARGGSVSYGYTIDVSINAKNSYGGYTGYQPYKFLLKNGEIISAVKMDPQYNVYLPFN